jgi:hypothetical protein
MSEELKTDKQGKSICPICGKNDWRCERRTRNAYWFFAYICKECEHERLPTVEERNNFNG